MISDLEKYPYTFTFMHFMVRALPEVQNHFRKQFSHKALYNYYTKKKLGVFCSELKSKNIEFPLYFQNTAVFEPSIGWWLNLRK